MIENSNKKLKRILISLITSPSLIFIYFIFCYELAAVCMYGRYKEHVYPLIISAVLLAVMVPLHILRSIRDERFGMRTSKSWKITAIVLVVLITSVYGLKIYKSGTNYGGQLAWFIDKLKTERKVEFRHNNIYEHKISGIFSDIDEKFPLPRTLYIVDDFNLKFRQDGTITSFDTFVYGKNEEGKERTYLISYDINKSKDIILRLGGETNGDYSDDKLLEPLLETTKHIQIKNTVSNWNESEYGLVYKGKRNWGYNTEGIVNINKSGEEKSLENTINEIIGYTVSIFVPGKEDEITPIRYNLSDVNDINYKEDTLDDNEAQNNKTQEDNKVDDKFINQGNSKEVFYISKNIGYRLNADDFALGSVTYSLSKTIDGGKSWHTVNDNAYGGAVSGVSGINFIDEKIGFIGSTRNGGSEGTLYRTDDGGVSFNMVSFPPREVDIGNSVIINVFDTPDIPYESNGVLNMLVNQGTDGDYNGNSKSLYQSKDKGISWEYIVEVK